MNRGAVRACVLAACAAGTLAALLGDASAQTRHASLTQVERDRRAESARAARLRAQASAARTEINALNGRLVESAQRRAAAEAAATAAEERLAELHAQMNAESARQARTRDALEAALVTAAFSSRRVEPRAVRAGIFARASVPEFHREMTRSAVAYSNAQTLAADVASQQTALAEAQTAIDAERIQLASLLERRTTAAASLTERADAADRRARQLAAQAQTLRELASRVQRPTPRGAVPSGPAVIPTAWVAPASGSIARAFGAQDDGGPAAQGVVLQTRAGAQVLAPAAAQVAYSGPFRSYGQVVILNIDGGYVVVLTGMTSLSVRVGDSIRAGQPVGEMPTGAAQRPELYVEVRRQGRPIDPGRWLASRGLTAERSTGAG